MPPKKYLAYLVFLDLQRQYSTRKYFLRDYLKTVVETDSFFLQIMPNHSAGFMWWSTLGLRFSGGHIFIMA